MGSNSEISSYVIVPEPDGSVFLMMSSVIKGTSTTKSSISLSIFLSTSIFGRVIIFNGTDLSFSSIESIPIFNAEMNLGGVSKL